MASEDTPTSHGPEHGPDDAPTLPQAPSSGPGSAPSSGGTRPSTSRHVEEKPPAAIGPYRVIRELGRGGMGLVYLATRDDDRFHRLVAIKVVKRGMDTEDILRRFETERQVLAAMNHPNIARLIDGGSTEDGRPYFVVEYVEGEPIDRFCDNNRLRINERLNLFIKVCSAVQYAHQNLVVHRDIKPGNIIVGKDGEPKLLDFGIVKLLNPGLSPFLVDPTAPELRLMTPEYASPEQVRGQSITTASDVYALGVLLYELLTGHRPYRLKTRMQAEIERIICESEPDRPSTAITRADGVPTTRRTAAGQTVTVTPEDIAKSREGRIDRLKRRLVGDLDNIVLMAMRKEPRRRYASAEALADDIRAHLGGMPVTARPATFSYRAAKFVQRNRFQVGAAAAVFLALAVGLAAAAVGWREASDQRDLAVEALAAKDRKLQQTWDLASALIEDFAPRVERLAGATPAMEFLVTTARDNLEAISADIGDDHALKEDIARAYLRVGQIEAGIRGTGGGDSGAAIDSFRRSLTLFESLETADPANPERTRSVAVARILFADILDRTGDTAGALEQYQAAMATLGRATAADPKNDRIQRTLQSAKLETAQMLLRTGRPAEAQPLIEEVITARRAVNAISSTTQSRRDLAIALSRLAELQIDTGHHDLAIPLLNESIPLRRANVAEAPTEARAQRDLLVALRALANAANELEMQEVSSAAIDEALPIAVALPSLDPDDGRARLTLIAVLAEAFDLRLALDDADGALAIADQRLDLARTLLAEDPENALAKRTVVGSLRMRGRALAELDRDVEALESLRDSLALAQRLVAEDPGNLDLLAHVAAAHELIGVVQIERDDPRAAARSFREAIAALQPLADAKPDQQRPVLAQMRVSLGESLLTVDPAGARAELEAVLDELDALIARDDLPSAVRERMTRQRDHAAAILASANGS